MPELPEVETVCRGLSKTMTGEKIMRVETLRGNLRIPFPQRLPDIAGKKVLNITRRAKYILINLDSHDTLIIHLGMSGRMVTHAKKQPREKHDHMVITMKGGTEIVFNDARRFGMVDLARTHELPQHKFFAHLGPEPLDRNFSAAYLLDRLKDKKIAIKLAIMDQQLVVGVGNIYASEALYCAAVDPTRPANSLKKAEITKLVECIRLVLKASIKAGGSSLRDYVQADGELGYFQHSFKVYDRKGEACSRCTCNVGKTGGILKITQGARSTFYCPRKQK
ncbi:MAG TPA: bifunctional DNA-formamidopyrimidine glycosylase/DNA-(apurinic or apyrimidinic site) lyase [Patescibacteria group bacterium]|nr:bifunctional DNA-formamidopyrimidine glycosylase/DNA-(apurinic or apyrimidinic site) lyase [Patescibacteria group bacterium]